MAVSGTKPLVGHSLETVSSPMMLFIELFTRVNPLPAKS
jgi:hypothetical protein